MRGYRDRDYLSTRENYFFCVVGSIHPKDRVVAYLKYIPNPSGRWGKGEKRFKRALPHYTMLNLLETFKLLEDFPQYLYFSSVMNIEMSTVPLNCIVTHLKPDEKTRQLFKSGALDSLQRKAVNLVELLSKESQVSIHDIGISGSILLDIHQEFSDLDLLVYGVKNVPLMKKTLLNLYKQPESNVKRFDEKTLEEWCINKTRMYPITHVEALNIYRRNWGRGLFYGTKFSMHPVKFEAEVSWEYGDRIYHPKGLVKIEATVSNDYETGFMPSVYRVEDVKFIEGPPVEEVSEVVTYEGLYGEVAQTNERILVNGKLEKVEDNKNRNEFYRVLVGSPEARGSDYIKLIES